MTILLTDDQVMELITIDEVLPVVENMFMQEGKGLVTEAPREKIQAGPSYLAYMGGANNYQERMGMKVYSHCGDNLQFYVILFDSVSGELLLLTRADSLGRLRTAATSAIGAKHLSNSDSNTIGIIGSGYQASAQLEAMCKVRKIEKVLVYSRTKEHCVNFSQEMSTRLGIPVKPCLSSQEAVSDADIVITVTTTDSPVIHHDWLKTGTTVIAPGNARWNAQEIDFKTIQNCDLIAVDTVEGCKTEAGELMAASEKGLFKWEQVSELSSIVSGESSGRLSQEQLILFKFVGMGPLDVVTAQLIYEKAVANKVGTNVTL